MNNKILYGIIAVAFVGGMFTVAYAGPMLPMITFAANTHTTGDADIDGDLNVDGTITGDDFDYSSAQTRTLSISPHATVHPSDDLIFWTTTTVILRDVSDPDTVARGFVPITGLPVGATITRLDCTIRDASGLADPTYSCELLRLPLGTITSSGIGAFASITTSGTPGSVVISDTTINHVVTDDSYFILLTYDGNGDNCGSSTLCSFGAMKITYTVGKAD